MPPCPASPAWTLGKQLLAPRLTHLLVFLSVRTGRDAWLQRPTLQALSLLFPPVYTVVHSQGRPPSSSPGGGGKGPGPLGLREFYHWAAWPPLPLPSQDGNSPRAWMSHFHLQASVSGRGMSLLNACWDGSP